MKFSKQEQKYIGIIGAIIIGLFLMEYSQPKPINWSKTFSKSDKIPYGGQAIYQLLPTLFEGGQLDYSRKTFYELKENDELYQYEAIVIVNDELSFTEDEGEVLSQWVRDGGKLFISSHSIKNFGSPLHAEAASPQDLPWGPSITAGLDFNDVHHFASPSLKTDKGFIFRNGAATNYFRNLDPDLHSVLAYNSRQQANFIRMKLELGEVYWHANPLLFTNYNLLLRNNHEYVAKAFSYLPARQKVLWDEYYKVGRVGAKTPLRVVLRRPSLSWAWFVTLGSIFTFILFNIKRRQRVVPIVKPPENTTIEFAETIGRLYLQHRDHRGIAQKMKLYFKDYVKRKLYLSLEDLDSKEEVAKLAEKSGIDADWIRGLFKQFQAATTIQNPSDKALIKLHNDVEQFYQATGIRKVG